MLIPNMILKKFLRVIFYAAPIDHQLNDFEAKLNFAHKNCHTVRQILTITVFKFSTYCRNWVCVVVCSSRSYICSFGF